MTWKMFSNKFRLTLFCSRVRVKKERAQECKTDHLDKWRDKRIERREPVAERVGAACKQNTRKPDTANPKGNIQAECV